MANAPLTALRQLPINLFTRDTPLAIPPSTYLLPANWRRFQLSELINKVLGNTPDQGRQAIPFDFLVEGEILRGSLEGWVKKHRGGDEESQVSVEYVRSLMPPQEVGRREVEDWVSGLSLARPGHILLSSYLSHIQILPLSPSQSPLYTLPLPTTLGATSATWLSPPSTTSDILLAAGGVDRAVHVFSIPSLEPDVAASEGSTAREIYTLLGHSGPVSSVVGSSSGREVVSSSWDGSINTYILPEKQDEVTEHEIPAEPISYLPSQKKRRKVMDEQDRGGGVIEGLTDGDVGNGGWRRAPAAVLRGHKGRVGGVTWDQREQGRVWSAGWDGSVRGWDVETGACEVVRQCAFDKSFLSISQFPTSQRIAVGSIDRTISLLDTREATTLISLSLPTTSPVPSLKTHPRSEFTLAAATYSGLVQIWDIRSPKSALFSVSKASKNAEEGRKVSKNGKVFGERLLAMDWDGERVVAGGEDGEVGIWNARGE